MTPKTRARSIRLPSLLALLLAGCAGSSATTDDSALAEPGSEHRAALTREALADLDRAGAFLASQKTFSFSADVSYDVHQYDGALLEFGGTRQFTVRRPDRLRVEGTDRTGAKKIISFDGETIAIDIPAQRTYVMFPRPGTLYGAIDHLVQDLGIPAPLEDLASENFAARNRPKIDSAYFVESVRLGHRQCDHLLYRFEEIDVQLWIEKGDRPLLCRISIEHTKEPGRPGFRASFRNWNLAPDVSEERFSFDPPAAAKKIAVEAVRRPGAE